MKWMSGESMGRLKTRQEAEEGGRDRGGLEQDTLLAHKTCNLGTILTEVHTVLFSTNSASLSPVIKRKQEPAVYS